MNMEQYSRGKQDQLHIPGRQVKRVVEVGAGCPVTANNIQTLPQADGFMLACTQKNTSSESSQVVAHIFLTHDFLPVQMDSPCTRTSLLKRQRTLPSIICTIRYRDTSVGSVGHSTHCFPIYALHCLLAVYTQTPLTLSGSIMGYFFFHSCSAGSKLSHWQRILAQLLVNTGCCCV